MGTSKVIGQALDQGDVRKALFAAFIRAGVTKPPIDLMPLDCVSTDCIFWSVYPDIRDGKYDVDIFTCTFKEMREEDPQCCLDVIRKVSIEIRTDVGGGWQLD